MKTLKIERRLHPRIQKQLPLNLALDGYDFTTTTEDLSCLGALCHVDKYIPPFTKIFIRLSLPIAAGGEQYPSVECKGVVVRSLDGEGGGFNIAIFFNEIKDIQKQKIAQYISRLLP